ncbi:MAG TPA: 4-hydroxy-tetrahydrodipicolinate synthase [Candidatus Limosilactobacillus merdipullorum]|uniref:4-hydroxy-tetrahydrodipicolinate synthase n=1 Tax=Candidatus Limosilactobacillus merdipullorum TaxID=2838653 RepID=A0A9D1QP11_9LACO|nr:4-hydroxy-tetrahydrodipicolinate synthase [Candidatus Limosilactobacillus merdipullorum]
MFSLENADLMTAIVTPFNDDGTINYDSLTKLTNYLIDHGSNGFVIGGTTGETPTLSHDEKLDLYRHFGVIVNGRVPVIAGTGSNNTAETIEFTNEVAAIEGIDYALVVVPPYNKPNQRGMVAHFTAVADAAKIPLVMYNIPGRTGSKMAQETVVKLSAHPNIAAVKQCASLPELEYIVEHKADDFCVFTGEDAQALTAIALGANGVISVASHSYCDQMREMLDDLHQGKVAEAGRLQRWLTPRMAALFMFPSPSPVKAVLNAQGFATGGCRLPILALNDEEKGQLEAALSLPSGSLTNELPLNLGEE